MRNLLWVTLGALLFCGQVMANQGAWNGATSDMNLYTNWTGLSGTIQTTDTLTANSGSAPMTATADLSCAKLITTAGYSGNVSWSGKTLTTNGGGAILNSTGTFNLGNGVTLTGASDSLKIGSGVGAVTATSATINANGTTNVQYLDNKGITILKFAVGASGICSSNGTATTIITSSTTVLALGASSNFTFNRAFTTNISGTCSPITTGAGYTFSGTAALVIQPAANNIALTIVPLVASGVGLNIRELNVYTGWNVTYSGDINLGAGTLTNYVTFSNSAGTYNYGSYTYTAGTINIGCNSGSGATAIFRFGSSNWNVSTFTTITSANTILDSMQSSTWTVTGSITLGVNHTFIAGTSALTCNGTAAHTITSAGKVWNDVTVSNTATAGTTFADATSLHTLTVLGANTQTVSWSGQTMTASKNIVIDGSGTLNTGTAITLTGNNSLFHIGSTSGAVTGTATAIALNGNLDTLDDDKGGTFKSLTIGAGDSVISTGAALSQYTNATSPLTFTNGGYLSLSNSTLQLNVNGSVDAWHVIAGSPVIMINTTLGYAPGANNVTVTFPAITLLGTGTLSMKLAGGTTGDSAKLTGNISAVGGVTIQNTNGTAGTFNGNGYGIAGAAYIYGGLNAGSGAVYNYGSGAYSFSSVNGSNNTANLTTCNYNSSVWNVTGNWTTGSTHTVNCGTMKNNFTGATKSTIDFAAKLMYDVEPQKTSGTVDSFTTSTHQLYAHRLTFTSGNAWMMDTSHVYSYTNNLTAPQDTMHRSVPMFDSTDFTRASGSHSSINDLTYFVGGLESDITTSGFAMYQVYLRKAKTAVVKLMDAMTTHRLIQDSCILVQNHKPITDSIQVVKDSVDMDTTVTVYTKDSLAATLRPHLGVNYLKQWSGGVAACSVWTSGMTRGRSQIAKTSGTKVVAVDPLRATVLVMTSGGFYSSDTVYVRDTLIDTMSDSATYKVIRLTTAHALVKFGTNSKPGFLAGSIIIKDSCGATVTNLSGHGLPSVVSPVTGPFSFSPSHMTDTVNKLFTTQTISNSGCVWDSIKISPTLPTGLTFSNGVISGTPTTTVSQTVYKIKGYNLTLSGVYSDSCYDTITVYNSTTSIQDIQSRRQYKMYDK